jgi:hypothetical protein
MSDKISEKKKILLDRRSTMKGFAVVATVSVLAVLALAVHYIPKVSADDHERKIFGRDSVVFGRTYSEWNAAWQQWADSIPTANHPLFDNGDCSVGQSGPVWFLGRKFVALGGPDDFDDVVRDCNVPAGKALYVAIYNAEDSALEETSSSLVHPIQIGDLRAIHAGEMDGVTDLAMQVDGENIPDIKERFRMQSPAFGFTLPDDNFFTAIGEGSLCDPVGGSCKGGTYFPGVDDGYYVMVAPQSIGDHTIHFHGAAGVDVLDVTYHIHVHR